MKLKSFKELVRRMIEAGRLNRREADALLKSILAALRESKRNGTPG